MAKRRHAKKSGSGSRRRKHNGMSYPRQDPAAYSQGAYKPRRAGKRKATRRTGWVKAGQRRRAAAKRPRRAGVRRAGVRRSRGRARYAAHTKGKHARVYQLRNRHGKKLYHVKGFRARRVNPSVSGLVTAGVAVAVGLAASVLASYGIDTLLANKSPAVQNSVLVALAAGTAFFVPYPAIAAGVATGLLVVPLAKALYKVFPSLANPSPAPSAALPPAVTITGGPSTADVTSTAAMSALHMQALHARGIAALHVAPTSMAAVRANAARTGSRSRVFG